MAYTLAGYYKAAGIEDYAGWAKDVELAFEPKRHQITGLSQAAYYTRFGLYDEQGCGKTLISQAWALWYAGLGNRGVVLLPPTLLSQYYGDFFSTFKGLEGRIKIEVYKGTVKQRRKMRDRWEEEGFPDIILMSYHLFRASVYSKTEIEKGASPLRVWAWLKRNQYRFAVCDEATILKKVNTTHKSVKRFLGREGQAALLLMTGTPAENSLLDLYGVVSLTNPKAYGSLKSFERLHVIYNPFSDYDNDIIGFKNKDLLRTNLYARGRRVEKKDVLADLPPKTFSEILVDLHPEHLALYRKIAKQKLLEKDGELHDFTEQQKLRQALAKVVNNPRLYVDKDGKVPDNAMEETLLQLLESIGLKTHKVLIFLYYKATAERLKDLLSEYNPALLNSTTASRRDKEIGKFLHDDECRILISQYRSGGVGLNLQSVCSHVVFYEPISVPGAFSQACDRVHRSGQKVPCNMYVLTPTKTVMTKIRNAMITKHEDNQEVTLDTTTFKTEVIEGVDLVGAIGDAMAETDVVTTEEMDDIEEVKYELT